jgi:hypothetical protein
LGAEKWLSLIQSEQLNIFDIEGVLVRVVDVAQGRGRSLRQISAVVTPASLQLRVLRSAHCHKIIGHRGAVTTYKTLREAHWWHGMYSDVVKFTAGCPVCQSKYSVGIATPNLHRPLPLRPWEVVSIDYAGKFGAMSSPANAFCLVIVDNFSRFTLLEPTPDVSAKTTLKALRDRLIYTYGLPRVLICDRAAAFDQAQLFRDFCVEEGIEVDLIAPDNHRANGLAESRVRELHAGMKALSESEQQKWWRHLRRVEQAIHS